MHSSITTTTSANDGRQAPDGLYRSLESPTLVEWNDRSAADGGIYGFNSIDPRSRSFNLVRGRLLELKRSSNARLIGVVSATPNVGKSFVCANISASLSRDPKVRTYAVDLDLRRGSLSTRFGLSPEEGLAEHLERGTPLQAYRLDGQALTVLPTRGAMVHSAELLATERAARLFKAMRAGDDASLFVCDLPPVFANDDAVATMAHLDSYILVTEEGLTTEREVGDAVEALGRHKLAGVVLNKFRGGIVSDGYGVEGYYTSGYGGKPD